MKIILFQTQANEVHTVYTMELILLCIAELALPTYSKHPVGIRLS